MSESNFGSSQSQSSQGGQMGKAKIGGQEGSADGSQLEQFLSYAKENWKTVLSELVAAGVTAYLSHSAKDKASKNSSTRLS